MAITLNTKVYTFKNVMNGISNYMNAAAGVAAGFLSLSARVVISAKATRVQWKLKLPVVVTEASSCACPGDVVRENTVDIILNLAPGATAAERDDISKQIKDLVASAEFISSITSLSQPTQ